MGSQAGWAAVSRLATQPDLDVDPSGAPRWVQRLVKAAHGAIGAHQQAVRQCYADFRGLVEELLRRLPRG